SNQEALRTLILLLCGAQGAVSPRLRLVNGPNRCAGRVEVLHYHQWGTVCDGGWDLQDAGVVCRQLGCGTALSALGGAHFGRGSDPIWLDEVTCTGMEAFLTECRARPWADNKFTHGKDAGVVCSGNPHPCHHLPATSGFCAAGRMWLSLQEALSPPSPCSPQWPELLQAAMCSGGMQVSQKGAFFPSCSVQVSCTRYCSEQLSRRGSHL
uniref:SRCR domain-containing protein n=1 Tax=Gopherus evgoodei TaxID=1825980 RepID=A0A8C4YEG9_9SAUR